MWIFRFIAFEIITERLEREFDVNLITTTPGVIYKVHKNNGESINLQNPSNMPDPSQIKKSRNHGSNQL